MSIKTFKDVKVGDIVYFAKSFPDPSVEERIVCDAHDSILNGKICIVLNELPNDNEPIIIDVNKSAMCYYGNRVMVCFDECDAIKYVDEEINNSIQFELKLLNEYVTKAQDFRNKYYIALYAKNFS